jgi:hypothetical protein
MATLAALYHDVQHLSPAAAHLALRYLTRSPNVPVELRISLQPVLLQRFVGGCAEVAYHWMDLQRGLATGPPPQLLPGPSQDALSFLFDCQGYGAPEPLETSRPAVRVGT